MTLSREAKARYITPASIEIGDTIRVTWKTGDITHSRAAKVSAREYEGSMRVFTAEDGQEILRWHPSYNAQKVTLLDRAPRPQETLAGL